ncbi:MAG: PadR family transcriptional regulator [Acidobacteria bacterium]|nr:PadR family transcriptional regulator [Acidobacteriota bacterium]
MTKKSSATTYGLLGLLAVRSWTGYELTHQVRRSLRYVWPSSEGHLYREQKRLVSRGWATVQNEPAGKRTRKRYTITRQGREALRDWLSTKPQTPRFEIEGILRLFYGDQGTVADLAASMDNAGRTAREMLDEMVDIVDEPGRRWTPLNARKRHRGARSRAPRVQRTAAVPRAAPRDCHDHRHHHPPTHGTRYVLHRDNTRNQHLGLPNRSPAHSRHAAPPRNYPEPQIHTLQSLKIDGGREPGEQNPRAPRPRPGRT